MLEMEVAVERVRDEGQMVVLPPKTLASGSDFGAEQCVRVRIEWT